MSPELKGSAISLSLLYDGLSSTNALIGLQNGAEKKFWSESKIVTVNSIYNLGIGSILVKQLATRPRVCARMMEEGLCWGAYSLT